MFFKYPRTEVFVQGCKEQKLNGCIAFVTATQNIYVLFLTSAASHLFRSSSKVQSIRSPNFYATHRNLDVSKILKSKTHPPTQLFLASTVTHTLTFPRKANSTRSTATRSLEAMHNGTIGQRTSSGPHHLHIRIDHGNSFSQGHLATQLCMVVICF